MKKITYGSLTISIDFEPLARGFLKIAKKAGRETYKGLSQENKAVISYGMAPAATVESFATQFGALVTKNFKDIIEAKGVAREDFNEIVPKSYIKKLLEDSDREFYLGLLDQAEKEGALLV